MNDDPVTLSEAARLLGVSYSSARRYVYDEGTLQSIKVFGGRRIPVDAIERFRAHRTQYPRWTRKRGRA